MHRYTFFACSNRTPGNETEYHIWGDEHYLKDVIDIDIRLEELPRNRFL
tara:strand:- start:3694 stop:3840 length:147 start_codon:yes stop_codon:yes gene_type:complete